MGLTWAACNPLFVGDVVSTFPRRPGWSNRAILAVGSSDGQVVRPSVGATGEALMSLALLSLRLLAALVLAASVAACDVFEGRQGVTAYADDSTITNSIRARYLEDPMVHFGDVGVTTLNGAVRLTGRVNSERERQRAAQIAREVKGVRGVNNEIAVR
jgi:osmotically-inducible protein OsmY